jgi:hypothetical protein
LKASATRCGFGKPGIPPFPKSLNQRISARFAIGAFALTMPAMGDASSAAIPATCKGYNVSINLDQFLPLIYHLQYHA